MSPGTAESPSASASPRTQEEFAASVSAEVERNRQRATKQLAGVQGQGNAVKDVSVTGLPVAKSEQFRSALVRVTNPTDKPAVLRGPGGVRRRVGEGPRFRGARLRGRPARQDGQ